MGGSVSILQSLTGRRRRRGRSQRHLTKAVVEALENRVYLSLSPIIAGASSVVEGSSYSLNLSANATGGSVVDHWTINWGDGTESSPDIQTVTGNPPSVTHSFTDGLGTDTISASATDQSSTYDANTQSVQVNPIPPAISISNHNLGTPEASPATFWLSSTVPANDPDTIASWTIDWGDSTSNSPDFQTITGNPSTVSHTFMEAGNFDVTATATDAYGTVVSTSLNYGSVVTTSLTGSIGVVPYDARSPIIAGYTSSGLTGMTWGNSGIITLDSGFELYGMAVQNTDTTSYLLVAGSLNNAFTIERYNANGTLDTTFGTGGRVTTAFGANDTNDYVTSILATNNDGKIVAVGEANGSVVVAQYTMTGALDTTFNSTGKEFLSDFNGTGGVPAGTIENGNQILIAGQTADGHNFLLERYNANGTLDSSFASGGKAVVQFSGHDGDYADNVVVGDDGLINLVGSLDHDAPGLTGIARFTPNGIPASGFGSGGEVVANIGHDTAYANTVVFTWNYMGKLVVPTQNGIVRFNTDGTIDSGFGIDGTMSTGLTNLAVVSENPFYAIGKTPSGNMGYVRFNNDLIEGVAAVAPTISVSGNSSVIEGAPYTLNLHYTGVGQDPVLNWTINWGDGTESSPGVQTVPGNPSSVTHTYASGPNSYNITASVTTTSGTYYVSFPDSTFNGSGTITSPFSGQSISLSNSYGPFVLPNGQVLVVGRANSEQALFLYNANGTLDTSFGTGGEKLTNALSSIDTVLGDSNGDIVLGGQTSSDTLALLYLQGSNGSPDTNFGSDGLVTTSIPDYSGRITSLVQQTDGKIVAAADVADSEGDNDQAAVLRYNNTNGALDTNFAGGAGYTIIGDLVDNGDGTPFTPAVALQSNEILISGADASEDLAVDRFNPDGTEDTTFGINNSGQAISSADSGDDDVASNVLVQSDGKIVIASDGNNGGPGLIMARFNADGLLDTSFGPGGTVFGNESVNNNIANLMELESDGTIVVPSSGYVTRYNTDGTPDDNFSANDNGALNLGVSGIVTMQPNGKFVVANASGSNLTVSRFNQGLAINVNVEDNSVADLTATATTTGQINLRWLNNSVVDSFDIMREGPGATSFSQVGTLSGVDTYIQDQDGHPSVEMLTPSVYPDDFNLTPNTAYIYEIEAIKNGVVVSTTNTASATTAAIGTYSGTPLETVDVPFQADSGQVSASITSQTVLQSGVHYELVALGEDICSDPSDPTQLEDPEYFWNDGIAVANAPYASDDWTGEVGENFVNAGIGIDDPSLSPNKGPYWGSPNPNHEYAIDVVGTGQALTFTFHNDYYPLTPQEAEASYMEVEIFAFTAGTGVSDLTATAVPSSDGVSRNAVQLQWAYVPPTSGSTTMEVLRSNSSTPTVFYDIGSVTVSSSSSSNPIADFSDDASNSLVPPVPDTQYNYEVEIEGGAAGIDSNIATATTGASEPYSATAADTVEVPVDGSSVSSHIVLQVGVHYELEASGTATLLGGIPADAEYVYPDNVPDSNGASPDYVDYGIGIDDPTTTDENKYADWGWNGYNSDHTYYIDVVGAGQTISFDYHSDLAPAAGAPDLEVQIFPEIPFAPTLTSAAGNLSLAQIDLGWTDTYNDETGFVVLRSPDGVNFTQISPVLASTARAYSDTTAVAGKTYWYEVVAVGAAGNSAPSNMLSAQYNFTGSIQGTVTEGPVQINPPASATAAPIRFTQIDNATDYGDDVANNDDLDAVYTTTEISGDQWEVAQLLPNGTLSDYANFTSSNDECALVPVPAGNAAGFTAGDIYVGSTSGQIIKISNGGHEVETWVTLEDNSNSESVGNIRGTMLLANGGPYGGDLVALTDNGQVFVVDSNGDYAKIADLPQQEPESTAQVGNGQTHWEAICQVPDIPSLWGSLAGTLLVGEEEASQVLFDIALTPQTGTESPGGPYAAVTVFNLSNGIELPENLTVVPSNSNFFALSNLYGGILCTATAAQFTSMVGTILESGEDPSDPMAMLTWNGTQIVSTPLTDSGAPTGGFEGVTFGTAGLSASSLPTTQVPLAGRTVYIDTQKLGYLVPNDPQAVTDANGDYTLPSLPNGTYEVSQVLPGGWVQTAPAQPYEITISTGDPNVTGVNFESSPDAAPSEGPTITSTPPDQLVPVGSTYEYKFTVSDPAPGVTLSYDLPVHPDGMYIDTSNPNQPEIIWQVPDQPTDEQYGRFVLRVTDSNGGVALQPDTFNFTTPANPTNLTAAPYGYSTDTDSSLIEMGWDAVPGATAYYIQRSTSSNFDGVNGDPWTDGPGLPDWAELQPGGNDGTDDGGNYLVSATGRVYYQDGGDSSVYLTEPLSPDTPYYYRVIAAIASDSNAPTVYSEEATTPIAAGAAPYVSATTFNEPNTVPHIATPNALNAVAKLNNQDQLEDFLSWDAVQDEITNEYVIERDTNSSFNPSDPAFTTFTVTPSSPGAEFGLGYYPDTDVSTDTTYYYRIRAVDTAASPSLASNWSDIAVVNSNDLAVSVDTPTVTFNTDHTQATITASAYDPTGSNDQLTFNWSASVQYSVATSLGAPNPPPPTFPSGATTTVTEDDYGHATSSIVVDLHSDGQYTFSVFVTKDGVPSSPPPPGDVVVTVAQIPTKLVISSSASTSLFLGSSTQFSAQLEDQFLRIMPTSGVQWSVGNSNPPVQSDLYGQINSDGFYSASMTTATPTGHPDTVQASVGDVTATPVDVTVVPSGTATPVTNVTATAASYDAVAVNFDYSGTLPLRYVVNRSGSDGSDVVLAPGPDLYYTGNPFLDEDFDNIKPGVTYTYTIQTADNNGFLSLPSNPASATTWSLPTAPTGVHAVPISSSQILVSWDVSTDSRIIGYDIYHTDTTDSQTGLPIDFTPLQSLALGPYFVDQGLQSNTEYYYEVVPVMGDFALGGGKEGTGATVSATTDASGLPAPLFLSGQYLGGTDVELTWAPPQDESGEDGGLISYSVYRVTSPSSPLDDPLPDGPGTGVTNWEDTTLPGPGTYYYYIEANYGNTFSSGPSNVASVKTVLPTTPPMPIDVVEQSETMGTPGTVTIGWSEPDSLVKPTEYIVLRSNTGTVDSFNPIGQPVTSGLSFTDDNAYENQTYYYEVEAAVTINGTTLTSNPSQPALEVITNGPVPVVTLNNIGQAIDPTTGTVDPITTETDIVGSVNDTTPVSWTLSLQPVGSANVMGAIVLATGNANVTGSASNPLYVLDPSRYPSGQYELVLTATAGAQTSTATTLPFNISSQLQIGNFTLPVTDMTVNVPGLAPIVISRTYDSTTSSTSTDLGYAWTLNSFDTNLHSSADDSNLDQFTSDPSFRFGDLVYITLPNGNQQVFQFMPIPEGYNNIFDDGDPLEDADQGAAYAPQFLCVDGSGATMQIVNASYQPISTQANPNYYLTYDAGGTGEFYDTTDGYPAVPFSPGLLINGEDPYPFGEYYSVTTSDGSNYIVNPINGDIVQSTDSSGNVTSYSYTGTGPGALPTSITSGGTTVNVTISGGLIQEISAGSQAVYYHYTDGELTGVTLPQDVQNTVPPTPASSQPNTFTYHYQDANGQHLLQTVTNALGINVLNVTYNASGGVGSLAGATTPASGITTSGFDGTYADQTVTTTDNGISSTTTDVYDSEGDVVSQIQEDLDSTGNLLGYTVTLHQYQYGSADLETDLTNGNTSENILEQEIDYQPYFIAGSDPTGQRFNVNYDLATPATQTDYYSPIGPNDPNASQIADQITFGPAGVQETEYSNYVDGKPQTVEVESGATLDSLQPLTTTTNVYDTNTGELLSSAVKDMVTGLTAATTYTYTQLSSGLAAGMIVETTGPGPDNTSVPLSTNTYYGNGSASYITAIPAGSPEKPGELASSTNANGVTTYYVYDASGNQILSYTPKTWTSTDGATTYTYNGWTVSETAYDGAGRAVATWQGTYIQGPGVPNTPVYTVSEDGAAAPPVTMDYPIYNDADPSPSGGGALVETSQTIYNAAGQVAETIDQYGRQTFNYYDANGNLVETETVANGVVQTVTLTAYDQQNHPILTMNEFDPNGNSSSTTNDQNQILTTYGENSAVEGTATFYDNQGRVSGTEDVSDVQMLITLTPAAAFVGYANTYTASVQLLNGTGGVPAYTVRSSTSTTYNPDGTVASTTRTDGAIGLVDGTTLVTEYTYYPDGQQETMTQESVPTTDPLVSSATQNLTTQYFYNAAGEQSTVIDPAGHNTTYLYDGSGQITNTTINGLATTLDVYDSAGNKTSETNAEGQTTVYKYDDAGDLIEVDQPQVPDGDNGDAMTTPITLYFYDQYGNQIAEVDPAEYAAYEAWLTSGTTADPHNFSNFVGATHWTYDENGNELSRTLPTLATGAITDSTPAGPTEYFTYNQFGQVLTHTDFDGQTEAYVYDNSSTGDGKLLGEYFFAHGATVFNGNGTVDTTNAQQSTTYTYTNLGQQQVVTDDSGATVYTYDAFGNMTQAFTPEGTINYQYNNLNQLVDTWTSNTATTLETTTAAPVVAQTSAVTWTQYTYDDLGRLATVTQKRLNDQNADAEAAYGYDKDGNKVLESDSDGDTSIYTYNSLNYLVQESVYSDTISDSTAVTIPTDYDLGGTFSTTLTWDATNGLYTTSAANESAIENGTGSISGAVLLPPSLGAGWGGNGSDWVLITDSHSFGVSHVDKTSFTLSLSSGIPVLTPDAVETGTDFTTDHPSFAFPGAALFTETYSVDNSGRRNNVEDKEYNGATLTSDTLVSYSYDNLDRLTEEKSQNELTSGSVNYDDKFTYDLSGNRIQEIATTGSTTTTNYLYNPDNELHSQTVVGGATTTFSYDNNGSETNDGTYTYVYDLRNRMVKLEDNAGTTTLATYVYDDAGNRVQETTGGVTSYYLTDSNNPTGYAQPLEVWTFTGGSPTRSSASLSMTYLIADHVYGQIASGATSPSFYITDGHGSTRAVLNASGAVITTPAPSTSGWFNYDAFGGAVGNWSLATAASTGVIDFYAGDAVYDSVSGLYMNGDGTRDRSGFRFIQMDSRTAGVGDLADADLYLYADANSISGFDPTGKFSFIELTLTIGLLLGLSLIGYNYIRSPSSLVASSGGSLPVNVSDLQGDYASIVMRTNQSPSTVFNALTQLSKLNLYPTKAYGNVTGLGADLSFSLQPWYFEVGQGSFSVSITQFNRAQMFFVARTNGGHPLRGWRYWGVDALPNGDIEVETFSVEEPATWIDSAKMLAGGQSGMDQTWNNMLTSLVTACKGTVVPGPLTAPAGAAITNIGPYLHRVLAPGEQP
jgi:uncharacterized delta-60 repeat protein